MTGKFIFFYEKDLHYINLIVNDNKNIIENVINRTIIKHWLKWYIDDADMCNHDNETYF